jgi:RNA polymerase sigma-70 factor (ECF subfamily)
VWRLCYSYLGSSADAEDATQATFMRLVDHPRTFESEEHERAWLLVVAANICKDVLKSAAHTRVVALPEEGPEPVADSTSGAGVDPAEVVVKQDDEVLQAVLALPEKYKEVVYLHYYEGWKTEDIARHVGAPPSTVRNRLRDARGLLRKALGGERT